MRPCSSQVGVVAGAFIWLVLAPALAADLSQTPARIKAVHVSRRDVERVVKLPGTLLPWEEIDVFARTSGYVRDVRVDRGSVVKAGDTLLTLEAPEMVADLEAARARLAEAQAEIPRTQAEAALAVLLATRLARVQKESPEGVPVHTVDEARVKATVAGRLVGVARARARTMEAALARAQAVCDLMQVLAPFPGVVTDRWIHPGAFVPLPGTARTDNARLLHLANTSRLRLAAAVPEVESRWVKAGTPLKFSADVVPGRVFSATVSRVAGVLDPGSRVLTIEADVDNPAGTLPAGAFARVELLVELHPNAGVVPSEALVQVRKVVHLAFILDGKMVRRKVKVGVNTGTMVEILGLEEDGAVVPVPPGSLIGIQIPDSLANGTPVTVELDPPVDPTKRRGAP
jgi:RND family efflux transporter MFP subunit